MNALQATLAAVVARNTRLEQKVHELETTIDANTKAHAQEMADVKERMLQVAAQVNYALQWIHASDVASTRQRATLVHGGMLSANASQQHIVIERERESTVARRLDLSQDGSTVRIPPQPPLEFHLQVAH